MIRKLWLLASNTLSETIRQKLFSNLLVFGVLMVAFAQTVGNLTFGRADRVVRSIGLGGISLALDLLAVLIGVAIVHREIERRTALVVLTRPVSRGSFIAGRFGGLAIAVLLAALGFSVIYTLTLLGVRGSFGGADAAALTTSVFEAWTMGAFAVLLSCITTPSLGTGVALGFWIAAASIDDVVGLTKTEGGAFHEITKVIAYLIPSFGRLNFRDAAIYQETPSILQVLQAGAYAGCFIAAFLILATVALRRRELL